MRRGLSGDRAGVRASRARPEPPSPVLQDEGPGRAEGRRRLQLAAIRLVDEVQACSRSPTSSGPGSSRVARPRCCARRRSRDRHQPSPPPRPLSLRPRPRSAAARAPRTAPAPTASARHAPARLPPVASRSPPLGTGLATQTPGIAGGSCATGAVARLTGQPRRRPKQ